MGVGVGGKMVGVGVGPGGPPEPSDRSASSTRCRAPGKEATGTAMPMIKLAVANSKATEPQRLSEVKRETLRAASGASGGGTC